MKYFARYTIFGIFSLSFHCLLIPMVSVEKSAVTLIEDLLYECFSFAVFRILSLSFSLGSLIIMCLRLEIFEFIQLGVVELFVFINLESLGALFLQILSLPLSSSLELPLCISWYSYWCPLDFLSSVYFSSSFFFSASKTGHSKLIYLQVH